MNEQLAQACDHLLQLLDQQPKHGVCNTCDQSKTARFIPLGMGEVACEDCIKNFATLALEHARSRAVSCS